MSTHIIISISSGIGTDLARHWLDRGHRVLGTYRTKPDQLLALERAGVTLIRRDLAEERAVDQAAKSLADDMDLGI